MNCICRTALALVLMGNVALAAPVISLVPADSTVAPGDVVSVDVFVDQVAELKNYQVELGVWGGLSGALSLENLDVDTSRDDYVFAGLISVPGTDPPSMQIGSNLLFGSANVAGLAYLGTYEFRVSLDAVGLFDLTIHPEPGTFLRDSAGNSIGPIEFLNATVMVPEPASLVLLGIGVLYGPARRTLRPN